METSLRVPLQGIRQQLKQTQLVVEREINAIVSGAGPGAAPTPALDKLCQVLARAEEIEARVKEQLQVYSARKRYLESNSPLPLYIIEYLVGCGYKETAGMLAASQGLESLVDFRLMNECHEIASSIRQGSSGRVLEWAAANRQHLRKAGSTLEGDARRQHFVRLAASDPLAAIRYSRQHLGKRQGLLGRSILALVGEHEAGDGWVALHDQFLRAFWGLHGMAACMGLFGVATVGLAALRTRNCSQARGGGTRYTHRSLRDHLCPACSHDLGKLALQVPFAHHVESILDGEMVMLPNGRCYGEALLREMGEAMRIGGRVYDPATLEVFEIEDLRRVFPT